MIGELAALGAALSWTVSAILYKKALENARPVSANIVRLTCTGGILLIVLFVVGEFGILASLPMPAFALACASGIIGLGLGDTLYLVSLEHIGVSRAVPLTCIYPLFNLLWAVLLIGESVTLSLVVGAILIVFGIWLLSQRNKAETSGLQRRDLTKGLAYALATAVLWSVSITMMDMAVTLPETGSIGYALAVNTIRVMAIAAALLVLAPIIDRNHGFLKLPKRTVVVLIVGGMVALGLGWFFLTYSFVETSESRAVPISSTTPLFSALVGITLLREKVTARTAAGSMLIVVGIFLIFLF